MPLLGIGRAMRRFYQRNHAISCIFFLAAGGWV
jgi:hypothetical protein